jgi:hypothetical protein
MATPLTSRTTIVIAIVGDDVPRALRAFDLDPQAAHRSRITFFEADPPRGLALRGAGIVLRSRVHARSATAAVTLAPCEPERFPPRWRSDWWDDGHHYRVRQVLTHDRQLVAASLLLEWNAAGDPPFSDRQQEFLDACAARPVDLARLVGLGPVHAHRWRARCDGFAVTAERWVLTGGGVDLLQLGVPADPLDGPLVRPAVLAMVRRRGLDPEAVSRTRTELVLEHLTRPS